MILNYKFNELEIIKNWIIKLKETKFLILFKNKKLLNYLKDLFIDNNNIKFKKKLNINKKYRIIINFTKENIKFENKLNNCFVLHYKADDESFVCLNQMNFELELKMMENNDNIDKDNFDTNSEKEYNFIDEDKIISINEEEDKKFYIFKILEYLDFNIENFNILIKNYNKIL